MSFSETITSFEGMGLTEAHQVLAMNNLRDRITLRTDGGLRTGRDIIMAAMMGAEEYGIGTAALIAMGCIMVRQCQSNTCPVGVCTQKEELRAKFTGNADKVVNLITFYAQEVREILASIGARSIDDIIFPDGVNLKNMSEATIKVLAKVSMYKLNGEQKKDLVVDILEYVVDNTDAGAFEFLDPVIKDMLPGLIDTLVMVEDGKLHIAKPKNCMAKLKGCLGGK